MRAVFSWAGLDKALSSKAQIYAIVAAALANIIILDRHLKYLLEDFLSETNKNGACSRFIDPIETKLFIIYLAIFLFGFAAIIIRHAMPSVLKRYDTREHFVAEHQNSTVSDIVEHFTENVLSKFSLSKPAPLIEIVESTKQLSGMTKNDIRNFSRTYFTYYFDYKNRSFIAAPLAKVAIILAVLLFGYQALRTFTAVVCIQLASG